MEQSTFKATFCQSNHDNLLYAKIDWRFGKRPWLNHITSKEFPKTPEAVLSIMQQLSTQPRACMVTGTPVKTDIYDTDRTMRNFLEKPIDLIVFDIDRWENPDSVIARYAKERTLTIEHIESEVNTFIESVLPPEFRSATCVYRLSPSFLKTTEGQQFRGHVMFLLEESLYPREIYYWIKSQELPIDGSFFNNLTQPIFTAAPVFKEYIDPLQEQGDIPRIGIITKSSPVVAKTWKPSEDVYTPKDPKARVNLDNIRAVDLQGAVGAFCRTYTLESVLDMAGYMQDSGDPTRFLWSGSGTGMPGVVVFENGYCYSHHEGDVINDIIAKAFNHKRNCLNAYDIAWGRAFLEDGLRQEFTAMLERAKIQDIPYQQEHVNELIARAEWLDPERGYEKENRIILDQILMDMKSSYLNVTEADHVFRELAKKCEVGKGVLKQKYRAEVKREANTREYIDPEATIQHIVNLIVDKQFIYPTEEMKTAGAFWCYDPVTHRWRKRNRDQTDGYILQMVNNMTHKGVYLDYNSKETKIPVAVKRKIVSTYPPFQPGKALGFKDSTYGIFFNGWYLADRIQGNGAKVKPWHPDENIRSIRKEDFVCRELPISYYEYENVRKANSMPDQFTEFLMSSTARHTPYAADDYVTVGGIYEMIGYILIPELPLNKMFFLQGTPGSGKSVLCNIIEGLVGYEHTTGTTLEELSRQFGKASLPNKNVVFLTEARSINFQTAKGAVPELLRLTGRDTIIVEKKNVDRFEIKFTGKIVMATNVPPILPDDSSAIMQRIKIFPFINQFRGTQAMITDLDNKLLKAEMPQIIRASLIRAGQLGYRGDFEESQSAATEASHYAEVSNPLESFIREACVFNSSEYVIQTTFTNIFHSYLAQIGQATDINTTRKRCALPRLRIVVPGVEIRAKRINGKPVKIIQGIGFKDLEALTLMYLESDAPV